MSLAQYRKPSGKFNVFFFHEGALVDYVLRLVEIICRARQMRSSSENYNLPQSLPHWNSHLSPLKPPSPSAQASPSPTTSRTSNRCYRNPWTYRSSTTEPSEALSPGLEPRTGTKSAFISTLITGAGFFFSGVGRLCGCVREFFLKSLWF